MPYRMATSPAIWREWHLAMSWQVAGHRPVTVSLRMSGRGCVRIPCLPLEGTKPAASSGFSTPRCRRSSRICGRPAAGYRHMVSSEAERMPQLSTRLQACDPACHSRPVCSPDERYSSRRRCCLRRVPSVRHRVRESVHHSAARAEAASSALSVAASAAASVSPEARRRENVRLSRPGIAAGIGGGREGHSQAGTRGT